MTCREAQTALYQLPREAPSIEVRHLFEIAAVLQGVKNAVRIVVRPNELAPVAAVLQQLDLMIREAPHRLAVERATAALGDQWTIPVGIDDPRGEWSIILAARTALMADKALQYESESSNAIGTFLGYPECCVTHYDQHLAMGTDWLQLLVDDWRARRVLHGFPPYVVNKIAYLFDGASLLPDYFPCSLFCHSAASLGLLHREAAINCGFHELVMDTEAKLTRPIMIWRGLIIQPVRYQFLDEDTLTFHGESALHFDWKTTLAVPATLPNEVAGCRVMPRSLVLLNLNNEPIHGSMDSSGVFMRFAGPL